MRLLRALIMRAVLVTTAILALLSIGGAFRGAEAAARAFNSPPLIAFWTFFGLLLLAGFVAFRRLLRAPGLLAIHLGALLILLGSAYGSQFGHRVGARLLGGPATMRGHIALLEGTSGSHVEVEGSKEGIHLPFTLALHDFTVDYYPLEDDTWFLVAVFPRAHVHGERPTAREEVIGWSRGRAVALGGSGARVRVLQYLASARHAYAPGEAPALEITGADGQVTALAAEAGREAAIADPPVKVRIDSVFTHLRVGGGEVTNVDWSLLNPAVRVTITNADGQAEQRYVYGGAHAGMGHGAPGGPEQAASLKLDYRVPNRILAEPDASTGLPAMEVDVERGERRMHAWMVVGPGSRMAHLDLAPLFPAMAARPDPHAAGAEDMHPAGPPYLAMVPRNPMPSEYTSDVSILEEGREVLRTKIEVNSPLHYGGYHFYQTSYGSDESGKEYSQFTVASDRGLGTVFVGFFLTCAGAFWWFWGRPVWRYFSGRGTTDGA